MGVTEVGILTPARIGDEVAIVPVERDAGTRAEYRRSLRGIFNFRQIVMVHLIGILRRQRPSSAEINIVDELPVDRRAQGQHLGGIFLFFVVFIAGMKALSPEVRRGVGH